MTLSCYEIILRTNVGCLLNAVTGNVNVQIACGVYVQNL